jgi:hypothetical protein
MKIKMLTLAAGPDGINRPGTIIDVDETVARQLISGCYATAAETKNEDNKTNPESGTAKP